MHSEQLSTPSQCDHTLSVFAEAYCICYRIALMLVCNWICYFCFTCSFLMRQLFFWFFFFWFTVLLNIFFVFWCRIKIHSLVCWWQWMDKLVFMSCVYVLQCWETNECVWLLMMQINKTSGAYWTSHLWEVIIIHSSSEIRRWGQMMPYGTAVISKAKESCLLTDDPYRHATPQLYSASHRTTYLPLVNTDFNRLQL